MIRILYIVVATALTIAGTASAQTPADLQGTWVWEVEGRNVFVLTLQQGPQGLGGSIERPAQVNLTMSGSGVTVRDIRMPSRSSPVQSGRLAADGQVMRTTATNGSVEEFVIRPDGKGGLLFRFDPDPRAPTVTLMHPRDPLSVALDWDPDRTYADRGAPAKSNPEMAAIFAADQADRQAGPNTDWKIVAPRDEARRVRVKQMLDDMQLLSAEDLYRAAFVFQHGEAADDFLLAHVLAMAAQAKGHPEAGWIAMATLDRYLHKVGRAQVLGTQNQNVEGGGTTKGLYDQNLIPDSLRVALGVPTRAQEAAQQAQTEAGGK